MTAETFTVQTKHATLGALEVGVLVCMFLLGMSTMQAYVYYNTFPLDHKYLKALVASVLTLEWASGICIAHTFYLFTIVEYGHIDEITTMSLSLRISVLFSAGVSSMVQMFYADRVRRFAGNWYIFGFFCILFLWRLGSGLSAFVGSMENTNVLVFMKKFRWSLMYYVVGTIIDLTVAVSLCYFLAKYRKATVKKTMRLIDHLMAWTIETGIITGLTSISLVICYITMPNNFIWVAIYFFLDRVYTNSFLALLNARAWSREQDSVVADTTDLNTPKFAPVVTMENTQQLNLPEFHAVSTNNFTIETTKYSNSTQSSSNNTEHDASQKNESLSLEKPQ